MPRFLPRVAENKFLLDYGFRNVFPHRKIDLDLLESIPFPYQETFRVFYTSLKNDEEGGFSASIIIEPKKKKTVKDVPCRLIFKASDAGLIAVQIN